MIDEIHDRQYQAGRPQLNAAVLNAISQLGGGMGNAFAVLNRIEYSAPRANPLRKAR